MAEENSSPIDRSYLEDSMAEPKLGSGQRFANLKAALTKRTGKEKVSNPGALAAYIGKKKYGASKMSQMAAKNRGK